MQERLWKTSLLCHHCVIPEYSKTHEEPLDCKTIDSNKKIALMPQTHALTQDKETIHIFTLPESTDISLTGLTIFCLSLGLWL